MAANLFDRLMLLYLFVLLEVLLIGLFAVDISLLTDGLIFRTLGNGNELDLIHLLLPNSAPILCYVSFCCGINRPMCMFRSVDIIDVHLKNIDDVCRQPSRNCIALSFIYLFISLGCNY
jgi:hypothetical protein